MPLATVSAPEFWQDLYRRGGDGWEMGEPHPSLVHFVETTPPPRGRVAVPGCGRGHDARYLARRGYDVVGFDFAPAAVREARALAQRERLRVAVERRDIFSLAAGYRHAFDGVWEYTCFCAVDPRRRAEYVETITAILKPGGWFLGVFFPVRVGGGGPPFPVSTREVRRLFAGNFRIERAFPPPRPVVRRQGQEWMVLATRTR